MDLDAAVANNGDGTARKLYRAVEEFHNTLMIQQVLAEPAWQGRLVAADLRALTPLLWAHVNPYGTFTLNMNERLPLEQAA